MMGPLVSAAQLFRCLPAFRGSAAVPLDPTFPTGPRSVVLHARDSTSDPIVAVVPDSIGGFAIEYRRHQGYDQGIGDADGPAAAVVIHRQTGAHVEYQGSIPIDDADGDRDYHSFSGHFTARLEEVAPDSSWVRLRIGGAEFWRNWNVDLQERGRTETPSIRTEPYLVNSPPCVAGTYDLLTVRTAITTDLAVTSEGFEQPVHQWTLDGTALPTGTSWQTVKTWMSVPSPIPGGPPTSTFTGIPMVATVDQGRLTLQTDGAPAGNFQCSVTVSVSESDPGVIKSYYPTVTDSRVVSFHGARVELDPSYRRAFARCFGDINDRYSISSPPWIIVRPGDPDPYAVDPGRLPEILQDEGVVAALQQLDDRLAVDVAQYIVGRHNLDLDTFMGRVGTFSGTPPEIELR